MMVTTDNKYRKTARIASPLLVALFIGGGCIFWVACLLLNNIFNISGRIVVDMIPLPLGAYDVVYGSSLSSEGVSKMFVVPSNESDVLTFYQSNLTTYGWTTEVQESTHISSLTNEPLTIRCIRAERLFAVGYIEIIAKQPDPENLSHVAIGTLGGSACKDSFWPDD